MAEMTNEAVETAMETNDTAQNSNENAEAELTIESGSYDGDCQTQKDE